MDLGTLLASAADALTGLTYTRGKQKGVKFGSGRKQTLLRAVLAAFGQSLTVTGAGAVAPRLRLRTRTLAAHGAALSMPELTDREASDALYEWSQAFRDTRTVDVEQDGQLYRIGLHIAHERDTEAFDLLVNVSHDTTGEHRYVPVVTLGAGLWELDTLFAAPATSGTPTPTSEEPVDDDAGVVTRFFGGLIAAVARKFPERLRRARRRIEEDAQKKRSPFSTAFAVVSILVAGWIFFDRIQAPRGLGDTEIDMRTGNVTKIFTLEHDRDRIRAIDPVTKEPRSPWANSIVDPVTGDAITFAGMENGQYVWILRAGGHSTTAPAYNLRIPHWWVNEDRNEMEPGFAVEPLRPTGPERNHAVFMLVPTSMAGVRDAMYSGQTVISLGNGLRLKGLTPTLLDGPWPAYVFSHHYESTGAHEFIVQYRNKDGVTIHTEDQVLCIGGPKGLHFARWGTNLILDKLDGRMVTWPLCDDRDFYFKKNGAWRKMTPDEIEAEYIKNPSLPPTWSPPRESTTRMVLRANTYREYGYGNR